MDLPRVDCGTSGSAAAGGGQRRGGRRTRQRGEHQHRRPSLPSASLRFEVRAAMAHGYILLGRNYKAWFVVRAVPPCQHDAKWTMHFCVFAVCTLHSRWKMLCIKHLHHVICNGVIQNRYSFVGPPPPQFAPWP
jgi:hypothetical protein